MLSVGDHRPMGAYYVSFSSFVFYSVTGKNLKELKENVKMVGGIFYQTEHPL